MESPGTNMIFDIDKNYLGRCNNGTYIFDATSATEGRKWSFLKKNCDIFSPSPLKAAPLRLHPFLSCLQFMCR